MSTTKDKAKAALALSLILPMPSLAVLVGMTFFPHTTFGKVFFAFGKVWVLALPLLWLLLVERERINVKMPRWRGMGVALASGLAISLIIVLAYLILGRDQIDPRQLQSVAANVGMDSRLSYLSLAAYWVLVNALLEEYVWRWFVVREFRKLFPPLAAIIASALGFTLHHVFATMMYFPQPLVILAAMGVFTGGVIWSWMYLHYRTIWPGYVSHAIVDIALFVLGYQLLFG